MTSREKYLSTRKELIAKLKELGVKNPAKMYPTVKEVAHENDPTCTVLSMKQHIAELELESPHKVS